MSVNYELLDRIQTAENLVERLAYALQCVLHERTTARLSDATQTLCRCALAEAKDEYPNMEGIE